MGKVEGNRESDSREFKEVVFFFFQAEDGIRDRFT